MNEMDEKYLEQVMHSPEFEKFRTIANELVEDNAFLSQETQATLSGNEENRRKANLKPVQTGAAIEVTGKDADGRDEYQVKLMPQIEELSELLKKRVEQESESGPDAERKKEETVQRIHSLSEFLMPAFEQIGNSLSEHVEDHNEEIKESMGAITTAVRGVSSVLAVLIKPVAVWQADNIANEIAPTLSRLKKDLDPQLKTISQYANHAKQFLSPVAGIIKPMFEPLINATSPIYDAVKNKMEDGFFENQSVAENIADFGPSKNPDLHALWKDDIRFSEEKDIPRANMSPEDKETVFKSMKTTMTKKDCLTQLKVNLERLQQNPNHAFDYVNGGPENINALDRREKAQIFKNLNYLYFQYNHLLREEGLTFDIDNTYYDAEEFRMAENGKDLFTIVGHFLEDTLDYADNNLSAMVEKVKSETEDYKQAGMECKAEYDHYLNDFGNKQYDLTCDHTLPVMEENRIIKTLAEKKWKVTGADIADSPELFIDDVKDGQPVPSGLTILENQILADIARENQKYETEVSALTAEVDKLYQKGKKSADDFISGKYGSDIEKFNKIDALLKENKTVPFAEGQEEKDYAEKLQAFRDETAALTKEQEEKAKTFEEGISKGEVGDNSLLAQNRVLQDAIRLVNRVELGIGGNDSQRVDLLKDHLADLDELLEVRITDIIETELAEQTNGKYIEHLEKISAVPGMENAAFEKMKEMVDSNLKTFQTMLAPENIEKGFADTEEETFDNLNHKGLKDQLYTLFSDRNKALADLGNALASGKLFRATNLQQINGTLNGFIEATKNLKEAFGQNAYDDDFRLTFDELEKLKTAPFKGIGTEKERMEELHSYADTMIRNQEICGIGEKFAKDIRARTQNKKILESLTKFEAAMEAFSAALKPVKEPVRKTAESFIKYDAAVMGLRQEEAEQRILKTNIAEKYRQNLQKIHDNAAKEQDTSLYKKENEWLTKNRKEQFDAIVYLKKGKALIVEQIRLLEGRMKDPFYKEKTELALLQKTMEKKDREYNEEIKRYKDSLNAARLKAEAVLKNRKEIRNQNIEKLNNRLNVVKEIRTDAEKYGKSLNKLSDKSRKLGADKLEFCTVSRTFWQEKEKQVVNKLNIYEKETLAMMERILKSGKKFGYNSSYYREMEQEIRAYKKDGSTGTNMKNYMPRDQWENQMARVMEKVSRYLQERDRPDHTRKKTDLGQQRLDAVKALKDIYEQRKRTYFAIEEEYRELNQQRRNTVPISSKIEYLVQTGIQKNIDNPITNNKGLSADAQKLGIQTLMIQNQEIQEQVNRKNLSKAPAEAENAYQDQPTEKKKNGSQRQAGIH